MPSPPDRHLYKVWRTVSFDSDYSVGGDASHLFFFCEFATQILCRFLSDWKERIRWGILLIQKNLSPRDLPVGVYLVFRG